MSALRPMPPSDHEFLDPSDFESMAETPQQPKGQPPQNQAPGVYVRTGKYQPHELDMLWSGSPRQLIKEDRSPVIFTTVGLLIGALVSGALIFLFTSKPEIKVGENELIAPIVNERELSTIVDRESPPLVTEPAPVVEEKPVIETKVQPKKAKAAQASVKKKVSQPAPVAKSVVSGAQTYSVRSGDTLEHIARRYYGSGTPAMINKIARANSMADPNRLQLGQKLVIPPASY